jgi:hypothetical protein
MTHTKGRTPFVKKAFSRLAIGLLLLALPLPLAAARKNTRKKSDPPPAARVRPPASIGGFDVRKVLWDMPREEVMNREEEAVLVTEEKVNSSGSRLVYHTQLEISSSRKPAAILSYYFKGGKLAMASYQMPPDAEFSYDNVSVYIKNYESLKGQLISEFGRPGEDLSGANAGNLGISQPALDKVAVWDNYRTKIFLILFEGRVRLIYQKKSG